MSLEKRISYLKQMANEVEETIYKIVIECFENDKPYPYNEIKRILKKYKIVYNKLWIKKYISITNNLLCKINPDREKMFERFDFFFPDRVLERGHQRVVNYFVLSETKYIPTNDASKIKIYNRLFPIIKNFEFYQIEQLYKILKRNVCSLIDISGLILDENWDVLFQQMFVEIIIAKFFVLSHECNLNYKIYKTPLEELAQYYTSKRGGLDELDQYYIHTKICRECFNEPVLYLESKTKNKSK